MLTEEKIQLGCVFLHMAHAVEQQFIKAHFTPPHAAAVIGSFVCQGVEGVLTFLAIILQIVLQFGFCINPFRKNASGVKFVERKGWWWCEILAM